MRARDCEDIHTTREFEVPVTMGRVIMTMVQAVFRCGNFVGIPWIPKQTAHLSSGCGYFVVGRVGEEHPAYFRAHHEPLIILREDDRRDRW